MKSVRNEKPVWVKDLQMNLEFWSLRSLWLLLLFLYWHIMLLTLNCVGVNDLTGCPGIGLICSTLASFWPKHCTSDVRPCQQLNRMTEQSQPGVCSLLFLPCWPATCSPPPPTWWLHSCQIGLSKGNLRTPRKCELRSRLKEETIFPQRLLYFPWGRRKQQIKNSSF